MGFHEYSDFGEDQCMTGAQPRKRRIPRAFVSPRLPAVVPEGGEVQPTRGVGASERPCMSPVDGN